MDFFELKSKVRLSFLKPWWRVQRFVRYLGVRTRSRARGFKLPTVRHDEPIPPNSNPFHYDYFSMGTPLVRGWIAMHGGSDRPEDPRELDELILVNGRTGQRIVVHFTK